MTNTYMKSELSKFTEFMEAMCIILVKRLKDYACPVNMWLGKLTTFDMTPTGWLGRKITTQTNILRQWYMQRYI